MFDVNYLDILKENVLRWFEHIINEEIKKQACCWGRQERWLIAQAHSASGQHCKGS